jgi:hypothetical protein
MHSALRELTGEWLLCNIRSINKIAKITEVYAPSKKARCFKESRSKYCYRDYFKSSNRVQEHFVTAENQETLRMYF